MFINELNVEAIEITPKLIRYKCPVCFTKYNKNGEPSKRAKNVIHIHGNEEHSARNRITGRSHHNNQYSNIGYNNVCIHITDKTLRKDF